MASASVVLLLVALISAICAGSFATPTPTLRIIGGAEAAKDDFPYMVSVRLDTAHVCGGSIVARNYILTAAHCVSKVQTTPVDVSSVTVRVGSKNQYAGGKLLPIEEIFIHKSYGSFLYDVALLKLATNLELGPKVDIIDLASEPDVVLPGNSVVIAGWGRTETSGTNAYKLQHGDAAVISASDCENSIGYGYPSVLCVQNKLGKGACNGDAGGPAVYKNKLVGVGNFVIGACGTKYPDVYARVTYFAEWINSIIKPQ
ncbi:serine protease SP24D-like [Eupeodes corollae]|uniref:serine protease SP24D-like n=1 Tax=Eupeodes corollae TaxID=290404 RepID=UPI00248FD90A|nr:serine protease SP24D-like [Eupeodes corollae]